MQTTLYMLREQGAKQMMSYVLKTREGKLIVIDGGNREEADNLKETLVRLGGPNPVVDLWLLTHPHKDHVDALLEIFARENPISVKRIYSSFLPYEFYRANDFPDLNGANTAKAFRIFQESHADICYPFERGQVLTTGSVNIHVLRIPNERFPMNVANNSSVVFRIDTEGQRILFLGDLGAEAGEELLTSIPKKELQAEFVQMAHHGQNGVKKNFYQTVAPKACLWNTPRWLWENDIGQGYDTGPFQTIEVRRWMEELGVIHHFITKDGEQVLPLPYPL